jgi:PhzF family phenazine biosynthesis protein
MTIPLFQVDAFTDRLFGGNPAGVCPLEKWIPDETLQHIAAENNLAETAFFVKTQSGFELRWFTPLQEIDLCGHATLAAAHVLFNHLNHPGNLIGFETISAGNLIVHKAGLRYEMDFPSRPPVSAAMPNKLIDALGGKKPIEVLRSRDYFLVYQNEEEVLSIEPNFSELSKIDTLGVIVSAPGETVDFVSRFFAPKAGIPEDPVTGSAHCSLTPYWAAKTGKNNLHAYQLSRRRGELWCELRGKRVIISGYAVTYFKGEMFIPIT